MGVTLCSFLISAMCARASSSVPYRPHPDQDSVRLSRHLDDFHVYPELLEGASVLPGVGFGGKRSHLQRERACRSLGGGPGLRLRPGGHPGGRAGRLHGRRSGSRRLDGPADVCAGGRVSARAGSVFPVTYFDSGYSRRSCSSLSSAVRTAREPSKTGKSCRGRRRPTRWPGGCRQCSDTASPPPTRRRW